MAAAGRGAPRENVIAESVMGKFVSQKTTDKKPRGRPPGVPNKATQAAREAIAKFVDDNTPRLQRWLDQIEADPKLGPAVAFRCVQELIEYHVPKLARTELTGADGGPQEISIRWDNEST